MNAIPMLLIGFILFALYMIIIKAKKKKEVTTIEQKTNTTKFENNIHKQELFDEMSIRGKGLQLLESIDIIGSTKSIDTLRGRIYFIKSIYDYFIKAKDLNHFRRAVQFSIDKYKSMYYDKILTDYQVMLLINPNINDLDHFLGNAIYNSFFEYDKEQQEHINKLKQPSAIKKRQENIVKVGYSAKYIFKEFEIPDYYNNLDKIEKIRKQYYSY